MSNDGESGFVLVPTLWLAGVIAAVLSAFLIHIRLDVKAAANLVENAKLEVTADGIVRLVAYELAHNRDGHLPTAGTVSRCPIDAQSTALIQVQDQAGLVDLNSASPAMLEKLGAAVGLGPEKARAVADRIADFRDADDQTRPNGAENAEYEAAGAGLQPKNGPFQDKAELDQVLDMTAGLRELLAPFVTVHSQQHGVDPAVVPNRLKDAIANGLPIAHSQRQSFAIDILVSSARGAYHRHAIVRMLGKADEPFVITEWSRGSAESAAFLRSAPAEECQFGVYQRQSRLLNDFSQIALHLSPI
jgi:type II secretory pathway component PulK